jgi:hypothetical protein
VGASRVGGQKSRVRSQKLQGLLNITSRRIWEMAGLRWGFLGSRP